MFFQFPCQLLGADLAQLRRQTGQRELTDRALVIVGGKVHQLQPMR